jgi:hypothetical protein
MFIATCKLITAPWILSPIWSNNAHDSWILVLVNISRSKAGLAAHNFVSRELICTPQQICSGKKENNCAGFVTSTQWNGSD